MAHAHFDSLEHGGRPACTAFAACPATARTSRGRAGGLRLARARNGSHASPMTQPVRGDVSFGIDNSRLCASIQHAVCLSAVGPMWVLSRV